VVLAAGCSAGTGSLSGTVSYRDKPVVYGTVMALCSDGITRSTNITPEGRYQFESLPRGLVQLTVVSPEPPDLTVESKRAGRTGGSPAAPTVSVDRSKWQSLPAKYADPRTSGQRTTVDSGSARFEIKLD
jgi:hypothetical protein